MKKFLTFFLLFISLFVSGPVLGMKRKRSPEDDRDERFPKRRRLVVVCSNNASEESSSSEENSSSNEENDYIDDFLERELEELSDFPLDFGAFSDLGELGASDFTQLLFNDHSKPKKKGREAKKRGSKYDRYLQEEGRYYCPDCPYSTPRLSTFRSHAYAKEHAGYKKSAKSKKKKKQEKNRKSKKIIRYKETVTWPPISTSVIVQDAQSRQIHSSYQTAVHPERRVTRDVTFCLERLNRSPARPVRSIKYDFPPAISALSALLYAGHLANDSIDDFNPEGPRRHRYIDECFAYLDSNNIAFDVGLSAQSLEMLIRKFDFCRPLRDEDGGLAENVSIIGDADMLERSLIYGVRDEYTISPQHVGVLQQDIWRLKNNRMPLHMKFFRRYHEWSSSPHILQNIRRFRWYGKPQIILMQRRSGEWIVLKLVRRDNQDHISVVLPPKHISPLEAIKKVYHAFRMDALPNPKTILPPK